MVGFGRSGSIINGHRRMTNSASRGRIDNYELERRLSLVPELDISLFYMSSYSSCKWRTCECFFELVLPWFNALVDHSKVKTSRFGNRGQLFGNFT